jgi:O-antigen/teichoic acid export membrane protein
LAATATSIVMWIEAERIAHWLSGSDDLIISIRAFSCAVVPMTLVKVLSSYFRGMRFSIAPNLVDPFIVPAGALLLVLLFSGATIGSVMELYAVGATIAALGALIVWLRFYRTVEKAPSRWVIRDALVRSVPIHLTVLGGFATGWITTLVVGASGTEAEVGIYRVAMQYVLVLMLLPQAVDLAMSPQVAALHATNRLHEIARTGRRMVGLTLLAGGIPAVILFVFAEYALAIFGHEFVSGAFTLRLLVAGQMFIFLFGPVGGVMVMTGLERLSLLNATAGSVVAVVSSMILIPRYGINGAAAASLLTGIFRLIVATVVVWYCSGLFLPLGIIRRKGRTASSSPT